MIANLHGRLRAQVVDPDRVGGSPALRPDEDVVPPSLTRMSGVFRIAPVLLPVLVTMITGNPVSRSVVPLVPPLLS